MRLTEHGPDRSERSLFVRRKRLFRAAALVIGAAIFASDLLSPLQGAVAVLYIIVVLLIAQAGGRRSVLITGLICALFAIAAFVAGHGDDPFDGAYVRLAVSLIAILAATLLSIRDHSARTTLAEQARMLELTHDTVVIRDADSKILYWNDGAEELYGWSREEALGRRCDELLQCQYPSEEVARILRDEGNWSGELTRTRRDGTRIVLASRWLLRRDPEGRSIGIIETSADLTEQRRADEERQLSETRYSTIFHAAGFAAWESDWSETRQHIIAAAPAGADIGAWLTAHPEVARDAAIKAKIRDANQAAVDLFGAASRDELIGSNVVARYATGIEQTFAEILAELSEGAERIEKEGQWTTLQGRVVDLVLRVSLVPEGEPWSRALVMAFDVTERNEARAKLEQASAELAHAARVSTLGQLAASIAHEVNQPLAAIINYGKSGTRWLARDVPDTAEAAHCFDHIVSNGNRAAAVIARVRSLARKTAPQAEPLALPALIDEAVALVQREANAAQVAIQRLGDDALPFVIGDRVQIQQVVVNLLLNGIQAMHEVEGRKRALCIRLGMDTETMVRVAVEDCGSGIGENPNRIFEPFFTTKADGMGMGLSICRSIIEAQGGRISAADNPDHGATIAFTLPVSTAEIPAAQASHTSV
jgi:PAS domain S-box-containing protein